MTTVMAEFKSFSFSINQATIRFRYQFITIQTKWNYDWWWNVSLFTRVKSFPEWNMFSTSLKMFFHLQTEFWGFLLKKVRIPEVRTSLLDTVFENRHKIYHLNFCLNCFGQTCVVNLWKFQNLVKLLTKPIISQLIWKSENRNFSFDSIFHIVWKLLKMSQLNFFFNFGIFHQFLSY